MSVSSPNAAVVLTKALLNVARLLELRQRDLADILGASEASVSRLRGGWLLDPASKEGQLALLLLRVFRSLDAMVGGNAHARLAWLHAHNDHLAGAPVERLRTVEGLTDVVRYLDPMCGTL